MKSTLDALGLLCASDISEEMSCAGAHFQLEKEAELEIQLQMSVAHSGM